MLHSVFVIIFVSNFIIPYGEGQYVESVRVSWGEGVSKMLCGPFGVLLALCLAFVIPVEICLKAEKYVNIQNVGVVTTTDFH